MGICMKHPALYSTIAPLWRGLGRISGHTHEAEDFVKALPLPRSASLRILDLGAGSGIYTFAALERFPNAHITAVDISPAMLRELNAHAVERGFSRQVSTIAGDLQTILPALEETFDLIITGGVLEYVEPGTVMPSLRMLLAPGGFLLNASVRLNAPGKMLGKVMFFEPRNPDDLISVFEKGGFKLLRRLHLPHTLAYFPTSLVKEGQLFVREE